MAGFQTIVIGWPKSWFSFAQTYVLEVADGAVWLGHLGKGVVADWAVAGSGAHQAMAMQHDRNLSERRAAELGAKLGGRVLSKMETRLVGRYLTYTSEGRSALEDSRRTRLIPASAFTELELIDASGLTGNTPPALKSLAPPYLRCKVAGKRHTFFSPRHVGAAMGAVRKQLLSAQGA